MREDLEWLRVHGFKRVHEKSGGALTRYRKRLHKRMVAEIYWEHEGRKFSGKVEVGPVTLMVFSTPEMRSFSEPVPKQIMRKLGMELNGVIAAGAAGLAWMR